MRIGIVAIGRLKSGPETELADRYIKRFRDTGRQLGLGPVSVIELPEARDGNADVRKKDEAQRLLAKVPENPVIIALDERGKNPDSGQFADKMAQFRDAGTADLTLIIGGPDGHGEEVLEAAWEKLSLGAMTLPHGLARVVLLEQLYRAATILAGHPYHRA